MRRRHGSRIKKGCSLEERHDQAMDNLKSNIWECVYHYNYKKGVIVNKEPPEQFSRYKNHDD